MKKIFLFVAPLLACVMTSCGVQNLAPQQQKKAGRTAVELSEAEQYAYSAPKGVLRAVGEYTLDEQGFAMRYAAAQARANLAEQISVKVKSGVELSRNSYKKGTITNDEVKTARDTEGQDQQLIRQVCDEAVAGATIVKVSTYMLENGTYQVFVCVEADTKGVAKYVAENQKVQQLVTDDERVKIEYNRDQFRQVIEDELSK